MMKWNNKVGSQSRRLEKSRSGSFELETTQNFEKNNSEKGAHYELPPFLRVRRTCRGGLAICSGPEVLMEAGDERKEQMSEMKNVPFAKMAP